MRLLLKREDLNHTGSHKINNVLGQALLAKRMGKTRLVAETGAGQHGVATATAAALLGLECKVYMGAVDVDRQALNVFRMRLLGAEVEAVHSGSRTLKDAVNEAMRDWVATVGDTHYCLGSVMGRTRTRGWCASSTAWSATRRASSAGPARRGSRRRGGLRRRRLERDRHLRRVRRDAGPLVGVEPAGGAAVGHGVPGVVHGMRSYLMQDEYGQVEEASRSRPGSTTPASGPSTLPALDRPRRVPARHRRRGARGVPAARPHRGHHPGARVGPRPRLGGARGAVAAGPDGAL